MSLYHTIALEDSTLSFNGVNVVAKVNLLIYYDAEHDVEQHCIGLSDAECFEFRNKVTRRELTPVTLVVEATADGFKGTDTLGGCMITDVKEALQLVKDYGMTDVAGENLIKDIQDTAIRLRKYSA